MDHFSMSIARAWPAITMSFFILLFFQNMTTHNASLLAIMITSALFNFLLKAILKQQRPEHWRTASNGCGMFRRCDDLPFSYGMPSGHAQSSVVFAICYTYLLLRSGMCWGQVGACVLAWVWTTYVCFTRVQLQCHTEMQVLVGLIVGAGYACMVLAIVGLVL